MRDWSRFTCQYLGQLLQNWFWVVFLALDFAGWVMGTLFPTKAVPQWTFNVATIAAFVVANVRVYAHMERQHADLRRRLEPYEHRTPRLSAAFAASDDELLREVIVPTASGPIPARDYGSATMAKIAELRAAASGPARPSPSGAFSRNPDYESEVEAYQTTYPLLLRMLDEITYQYDRLLWVEFAVQNSGTASASDITLEVTLPEVIDFAGDREDRWVSWDLTHEFALGEPVLYAYHPLFVASTSSQTTPPGRYLIHAETRDGPKRKRVMYHVPSLAPGASEMTLEPVLLWFGAADVGQPVEFVCRIMAAELPEPVVSQMTVVLLSRVS